MTDYSMPGMSGYICSKESRNHLGKMYQWLSSLRRIKSKEFLLKPVKLSDLKKLQHKKPFNEGPFKVVHHEGYERYQVLLGQGICATFD
ncbi:Two-component response regulator ARR7, partial [Bienertia sinuspersici]